MKKLVEIDEGGVVDAECVEGIGRFVGKNTLGERFYFTRIFLRCGRVVEVKATPLEVAKMVDRACNNVPLLVRAKKKKELTRSRGDAEEKKNHEC